MNVLRTVAHPASQYHKSPSKCRHSTSPEHSLWPKGKKCWACGADPMLDKLVNISGISHGAGTLRANRSQFCSDKWSKTPCLNSLSTLCRPKLGPVLKTQHPSAAVIIKKLSSFWLLMQILLARNPNPAISLPAQIQTGKPYFKSTHFRSHF